MRPEILRKAFAKIAPLFACAGLAAIVFAVVLASAPQWHERLHDAQSADHACAVTFFASGQCAQVLGSSTAALPIALTAIDTVCCETPQTVTAQLASSILEHAPPALA